MVTEGLHALFAKAEMEGALRGVSIYAAGPKISHLLFTNDSLVFCRASIPECIQIQALPNLYMYASSQNINRGKTNIFFSTNTSHKTSEGISNFLGVLVIHRYEQYLRLPSLVGRAKKKSFS